MPTPLRYVPQDAKIWKDGKGRPIAVVEMTIRTLLGLFLLKRTTRTASLIPGVLGRAKGQLDFELYGYAYLTDGLFTDNGMFYVAPRPASSPHPAQFLTPGRGFSYHFSQKSGT